MSANTALKLRIIKRPEFYRKSINYLASEGSIDSRSAVARLVQGESHSLHTIVSYEQRVDPDLAAYLICNFTSAGDVVLDPFCGFGTIGVETALHGRIPVLSDINRFKLSIAHALLSPVDIAEVTLALQLIPFSRPVDTRYHDYNFEPFYDIRTFCELINLKNALRTDRSKSATFLRAIAMGLLHGQSSGFLSVYSPANLALTPAEQLKLNHDRRQVPDYRPLMPRLLRKTAAVLRDGTPSIMQRVLAKGALKLSDARNLKHIPSASVDSVITAPPSVHASFKPKDYWLELWFLGLDEDAVLDSGINYTDSENVTKSAWLELMNASLLEQARVLKSGGKLLFIANEDASNQPNEDILQLVQDELSAYYDPEGMLSQEAAGEILGDTRKLVSQSGRKYSSQTQKVLILTRK